MKPFEIFRPGTHTSAEGETLDFADADLAAIAAGYDTALHHAPIVVGHPKTDAPAYGWVDGLEVKAGRLVAMPADVDTAFSELVREKKFRKVSAAFYRPDSANNPKPGTWYLRHVGFLGAAAPAVKGLKAIEFADEDGTVFADLDFAEFQPVWLIESFARMFRGIRDYFVEKEGAEAAERLLPQWHLDDAMREAAEMRAREANPRPIFSEATDRNTTMTQEELAAQQARLAELERREAEIKAREASFAEAERTARVQADAAFIDKVIGEGRLPIGLKAQAEVLFADLSDDSVSFADGDRQVSMSPRAAFRDLLGKLPLPVETGELAKGDTIDFADAVAVGAAIKAEISKAREAGETLSPAEAAARITKG